MQIADYRAVHSLSRKDFAELLGVTPETVRLWEAGLRKPSTDTARLIEKRTDGAVPKHEIRPDVWAAGAAA